MSLIDDIQAKADLNGDGKVSAADLEALKDGDNEAIIERLKGLVDRNGDGKIDMSDIKSFDFGDALDQIKGLFGK